MESIAIDFPFFPPFWVGIALMFIQRPHSYRERDTRRLFLGFFLLIVSAVRNDWVERRRTVKMKRPAASDDAPHWSHPID